MSELKEFFRNISSCVFKYLFSQRYW